MMQQDWYLIPNEETLETPALVFYETRIRENIGILKGMINDIGRLRPHVKTYKCLEITHMLIDSGIHKFKCATIAEAEMLGLAKAKDVLLAYQPVGENINRFFKLIDQYSGTSFSCLLDNIETAKAIADMAVSENKVVDVYIDLNVGMNRTGILPALTFGLVKALLKLPHINVKGLHAYDGHIHDPSIDVRSHKAEPIIVQLHRLKEALGIAHLTVIAGGTPTFPVYAKHTDFDCSPGTFILWDKGYQDAFAEQQFSTAALVISRIVSKPTEDLICTDLGHKAVAAEKDLKNRVFFLNSPQLEVQSQSEEHLVLKAENPGHYKVGDMLYGLPYHICPTVALYEKALCSGADQSLKYWDIISRKRKITI
jgi:D-serine deaminase-like pyridoxal phosphate-dependent protein